MEPARGEKAAVKKKFCSKSKLSVIVFFPRIEIEELQKRAIQFLNLYILLCLIIFD